MGADASRYEDVAQSHERFMTAVMVLVTGALGWCAGFVMGLAVKLPDPLLRLSKRLLATLRVFFLVVPGQTYLLNGVGLVVVEWVDGPAVFIVPREQRGKNYPRWKIDRFAFSGTATLLDSEEVVALEGIREARRV